MPRKNRSFERQGERSPIFELARLGQSIWLDSMDRTLIEKGELLRYVRQRGLRGMTSNPALFAKAISSTDAYSKAVGEILNKRDKSAHDLYEELTVKDIQDAADILKSVYLESEGRDGYVSLEVSPHFAHKTQETLEEARRLWKKVARSNLMIKVPGTSEGISAVRQLISEGINVNITLLFHRERYEEAAEAYLEGLESALTQGRVLGRIASVASFFLSRIDTAVDQELESRKDFQDLLGKVAISNAKLAYRDFKRIFQGFRWKRLEAQGAQLQRLLWASTSVKNSKYRDVLYVEELIGPYTVNTVPPATFDSFEDHGQVRLTLEENVGEAESRFERLESAGISFRQIADHLLTQGLQLFSEPYDNGMGVLERKRREILSPGVTPLELKLPILIETAVGETLLKWKKEGRVRQLWNSGAGTDWLRLPQKELTRISDWNSFQEEIRRTSFEDIVLIGMGGASLCAETLDATLDRPMEFPDFHILDSTNPNQIHTLELKLNLRRTLFIVSSKSGTTLESQLLFDYFYERVRIEVGEERAGDHFIAVTDPGSPLEKRAREKAFWKVFQGYPGVGGRFSVLSPFGLVPAAAMGISVRKLLREGRTMKYSCEAEVSAEENPGVVLGVLLGTLALCGKDKVTLICSPKVWGFALWFEQLLAESTGKRGKGLVPIIEEKVGPPSVYGEDRVFIYLHDMGSVNPELDSSVRQLEEARYPVVVIHLKSSYSLAQEFFRWELATAVVSSILEVNAFDQPDVESSKEETRKFMAEYEKFQSASSFRSEKAFFEENGIRLFADQGTAQELMEVCQGELTLRNLLRAHLNRIRAGDYFAILAYLEMSMANESLLQELRHKIRDEKKVATCLEFGPRYLHSTGQLHKGGPNKGVFLMITQDPGRVDLLVPSHPYTFGIVQAAQAAGDQEVLLRRGRRFLRVHFSQACDLRALF